MPNERYYKRVLKALEMVPNYQVMGSASESSPMEKVKTIVETAKVGGDIEPFIEFLDSFDPAEVEDDEEEELECGACGETLGNSMTCDACGAENE